MIKTNWIEEAIKAADKAYDAKLLERVTLGEKRSHDILEPMRAAIAAGEQVMAFVEAIKSPEFAYTRARSWRASGYVKDDSDYIVYVYHRDTTSPTGVKMVAAMNGLKEATAIIDKVGAPFPLSPTEGLRSSR